ncbi:MAG: deoxyribonuclease IV [Candidatus Omnitrophica bacterium]|nr:deoxyribonuclease IV [Candidatus Omnitrophota bacterium]
MNGASKQLPRLGAHMSMAGGFHLAVERGLSVGCQTIQIFTKSNNQWDALPISDESAKTFQKAVKNSGVGPVFAHTAYLINVGSPEKETFEKSKKALKVEVERATTLGLAFIVLHPGSHKETGEEPCLKRISETVVWVLDQTKGSSVKVLYEIAAGQGSAVGHTFEHLNTLLKLTGRPDRTGICLDTCHLFAAGYDLRTPAAYQKTMDDFDRIVGLKNIRAIHLNDSKKELGARVDRHEHIGQGQIGLEGFRCLLNDPRFSDIPMVLETPKDEKTMAEDVMNLKTLRGLIKKRRAG